MSLKIKTMKKLLITLLLTLGLTSLANAQTTLFQGGTGLSTSTVGQLLVGTSSTLRYSRLDVGSAGTVLQASSTSPFRMAWVTLASIFDSLLSSNNTWTGTNTFNATTTLNKVVAGTSAGLQFFSNGLTQVADFGAGGGSNASFLGGVNITGNLAVDTDTLYVDSTNNRVGIGTTSPIAKLDVFGNFNIGTSSISNLFVNTATQKIGFNTSGSVINMDSDFTFQGGTDLMSWKDTSGTRVASVSNLGYFNAPSYKGSQVYNDSNDLTLYSIASGKGVVVLANASTSPAFTIKGALNGPQTADYFRIKTYSGTGGDILTVTGTGNVGIGTTNPSAKLTVGGSSGAVNGTFLVQASTNSEWFSVGTAGNGVVQFNTAGGSTRAGGVDLGARFNIAPINDSMPTLAVRGYSGGTSDIIRVSSPSATSGDYLIVKSGGNVGIGTTTPTSLLTVASSTQSTSYSIFSVFNALATPVMNILGSGAVLFGTITTANCGNAPCGLTVATTTQFTAGTVARVVGYSSAASTTINLNTTDIATTTIDRATTFVNPTGTAYDGSMFEIRARATTTQTVYWDTAFASSTDLTNVSSVASGTTRFLFEYRQDVGKWELVGKLAGYIN